MMMEQRKTPIIGGFAYTRSRVHITPPLPSSKMKTMKDYTRGFIAGCVWGVVTVLAIGLVFVISVR
jgi:hypothetical protein